MMPPLAAIERGKATKPYWESTSRFLTACARARSVALGVRVAETPGAENLDGERKTVTALFADIKGSMELMEDLDPEEARAIVDPALGHF
jgi:class 3 adenylate cyclase